MSRWPAPIKPKEPKPAHVGPETKGLILSRPLPLETLGKFAQDGKLWAILDACDEPEIPGKVEELGARAKCLYRGTDDADLLAVAPYLAHLQSDDVDWLGEVMWQRFWGIFAVAQSDLKTMRRHFRKFLTVELEGEGPVYFRYYDPRVLETFLPTCDNAQLKDFYGPIDAFAVPAQKNPDTKEVQLLTVA